MNIIELKNITKTYSNGFSAVKNVNLEVKKKDIVGVIGYSGAGKSTLIRLINRLEEPSGGEVKIDGVDILSLKESELQKIRQNMGMIFQHFNLLSSRTVVGNIAFALEIAKWDKNDITKRVNELLELVGLSDKADFYPSQLSGGQKQRVAIARALANHPKILLCDEATSALDAKTTKSILSLLKDIQAKFDLSIVLITHQIEVVKEICNKMCVMSDGEIVERGNVKDIFMNPKHSVTQELLSFLPREDINNFAQYSGAYKIIFTGPNASRPLLSEMIRRFNVDLNILGGNIETLVNGEIGYLIIKFSDDTNKDKCIKWLEEQEVTVQNIGQ